jgi:hypothetical protein
MDPRVSRVTPHSSIDTGSDVSEDISALEVAANMATKKRM